MRNRWRALIATVSAAACLAVVIGTARAQEAEKPAGKDDEYHELMKTFVDTFDQIERSYVTDVNRRELLEAAIKGMLGELDQYSSYISPDELTRFNQTVEQEFGGIGIQVTIDERTKRLTVMTPLPGTPAYKAGIKAGDVIMEIEGKSTEGFTIDDAVKALKGNAGEPVNIGVLHAGSDKIEQVRLVREIIQVATVLGDRYTESGDWNFFLDEANKIAYVRLTHFSRHSTEELQKALETLQKKGMKALVLDLRFNPGGLLSQATEIADLFLESGKIVSTKGRNTPERTWEAREEGTFKSFPMAVLVNRYSASASEIVSAALQDHKRAVVIGERTWGKGSVQNVIELQDGQSALKLTTASYHRPSGKNIHKLPDAKETDEWGVKPDDEYEVKLSLEEMQKYLEYRRDRDVLSGNGPPKSDFEDKQLARAVKHLREKLGGSEAAGKQPAESKDKKADAAEAAKPAKSDDSATRSELKLRLPSISAA